MQYQNSDAYFDSNSYIEFPQINHRESTSPKKKKLPPIIANLADTQYEVVEQVCDDLNWNLIYDRDTKNWDIKWIDGAVSVQMLSKMAYHQKINHFPGMNTLSRKNNLAKNIMKMQTQFSEDYDMIPNTFLLPQDSQFLKNYYQQSRKRGQTNTFIVKPEASSQGRGIFLTQSLNQIEMYEHCVVQKYVTNPLLYKGLKFDMRIYALVAGCDPLRLYIYNEGLVRFATEKYQYPDEDNLDNLYMHLTNYAINKDNPKYVFNESIDNLSHGHKKSLAQFFQTLKSQGYRAQEYWSDIKDIIVKTLISGQPHLQHQYKIAQPHNLANNMCFEVLGFDFMISDDNKVYLLEVNYTPSFSTDSPLDELIKSNIIRDTLILMNITQKAKAEITRQCKQQQQRRVFTGKINKLTPEEKQRTINQLQKKRDQYEKKNLGSYQRIFPNKTSSKQSKYQQFLEYSLIIYRENNSPQRYLGVKRSNSKYRIKRILTNHTIDGDKKKSDGHERDRTTPQLAKQQYKQLINKETELRVKKMKQQIDNPEKNHFAAKHERQSIFMNPKPDIFLYEIEHISKGKKEALSAISLLTKNQEQTMFSRQIKNQKNYDE